MKLRALEPADADILYQTENDPESGSTILAAPISRELLRQYALTYQADPFRDGSLRMVAEEQGEVCGIADLYDIEPVSRTAWVGIYILPQFRRHGYGAGALRLLASHAFVRLNLKAIAAIVSTANTASRRAFVEAGFALSGTLPKWLPGPSGRLDADIFTLAR